MIQKDKIIKVIEQDANITNQLERKKYLNLPVEHYEIRNN